jgi:hypothetical protein
MRRRTAAHVRDFSSSACSDTPARYRLLAQCAERRFRDEAHAAASPPEVNLPTPAADS